MKGEVNKPGQPYKKEDFDNLLGSIETGVRERLHDSYDYGIVANSQMNAESRPFEVSIAVDSHYINVGTGIAYGPYSSVSPTADWPQAFIAFEEPVSGGRTIGAGERIVIPTGATGYARSAVSETGAYYKVSDGIGGFIAAPQSSGAINVPVPGITGTCYVWLAYISEVDDSVYSTHKYTSKRIYYKKNDGYDIVVTTTDALPDSDPRFFKIATFNAVSGVAQTGSINQAMVPTFKTRTKRVGISVGVSGPTAYAIGTTGLMLDDHINGIGTGTVTPQNVHGLSIEDMGGYSTESHVLSAHDNGIHGTTSTLGLAVADYPLLGQRVIEITQLISGEKVMVGGALFSEVLPKIGSGNENAYVAFSGTDTDGNYYVMMYRVGDTCQCAKYKVGDPLPEDYVYLCVASWASAGGGTLTITDDVRERMLGSIGADQIQANSITSYKINAATPGSTAQDITTGSGIKTDHIVDMAVTDAKIVSVSASKVIGVPSGITVNNSQIIGPIDADKIASGITGGQLTGPIAANLIGPGLTGGQIASSTIRLDNLYTDITNRLPPTGSIAMWPVITPPTGWLNCDGAAIPGGAGGQYNDLVVLLNSLYTPNLKDKFPLSIGDSRVSVGIIGGEETHALGLNEMPNHTHTNGGTSNGTNGYEPNSGSTPTTYSSNTGSVVGSSAGITGAAHNNMPPFFTLNFIIKT